MPRLQWRHIMTHKDSTLRFLLALGNKKMVIMQNAEDVHIYSDEKPCGWKGMSTKRLAEAVTSK